jgi:hypothetical protein
MSEKFDADGKRHVLPTVFVEAYGYNGYAPVSEYAPMSEDAATVIERHIESTLPPGSPPEYKRIVTARRIRKSTNSATYVGELVMFDDRMATIEVTISGDTESHRWLLLEGGAAAIVGGRWQRLPPPPPSRRTPPPPKRG